MSDLTELATWYVEQCDGDWEHARGISIRSCDNPGWWVEIDVVNTSLEGRSFHPVTEGVSEAGLPQADRWLHCLVREGVWHGAGDPSRLEEITGRFVTWAREATADQP